MSISERTKRVLSWLALSVVVSFVLSYGIAIAGKGDRTILEVFGDGSLYMASVGLATGVLSRLVSRQFTRAHQQASNSPSVLHTDDSEPVLLVAAIVLALPSAALFGLAQGQVATRPSVERTLVVENGQDPGLVARNGSEDTVNLKEIPEAEVSARVTKSMDRLQQELAATQRADRMQALNGFLEDLQADAANERRGTRLSHVIGGVMLLIVCGIVAGVTEARIEG